MSTIFEINHHDIFASKVVDNDETEVQTEPLDASTEQQDPHSINGSVIAGNRSPVPRFPSETELSAKVQPRITRRLMHHDLKPAGEVGELVKLTMANDKVFRKSLTAPKQIQMTVKDTNGVSYHGVMSRTSFQCAVDKIHDFVFPLEQGPGDFTVLQDANCRPFAAIVRERHSRRRQYTVYGTRPLYSTDEDAFCAEGFYYYSWFKVIKVDVLNGDESVRSVLIRSRSGRYVHTLSIQSFSTTVMDSSDEVFLVIMPKQQRQSSLAMIERQTTGCWDMTMAPGVDPSMILCLTAVLHDVSKKYSRALY